jgi:serine phosphatase RsbU (regulator of sigma subunit)/DNA-binding response OmpR family regulator
MANEAILVVEDETLVALELKENLERLGYSIPAVVEYGEDVVAAIAQHRPDLVLMDIRLCGGVDGIEAAYQAKAEFEVPVIYLTAYSDAETLKRAAQTGPDAFLLKPIDDRELAANIELALERAKGGEPLRRELRGAVSLADALDTPLIIADLEGRVAHVNAGAALILGVSDSSRLARTELSGLLKMPKPHARRSVTSVEPLCGPSGKRYGSLVRLAPKDMMEKIHLESSAAEANSMLGRMLPKPDAAGPGYRVGGFLQPCLSGSGDFYDVFRTGPDKVAFYGIDVMGHGVIATLMAFALSEALPAIAGSRAGPRSAAVPRPAAVVRSLYEKYSGRSDAEAAFFTICIGSIDTATGEYIVARGGHTPALLLAAAGGREVHYTKGAAVGVVPEAEVEEARGALAPGDRLVVASDGLLDAFDTEGSLKDAIRRLAEFCESCRDSVLGDFVEALKVRAQSGGKDYCSQDDISVLVIEREA